MKTILVNTTIFYYKNNIRLHERHLFKKYNGMCSLKMVFARQAHIIFRIIQGKCSNSNANIYLNKQCISLRESQTLAATNGLSRPRTGELFQCISKNVTPRHVNVFYKGKYRLYNKRYLLWLKPFSHTIST